MLGGEWMSEMHTVQALTFTLCLDLHSMPRHVPSAFGQNALIGASPLFDVISDHGALGFGTMGGVPHRWESLQNRGA